MTERENEKIVEKTMGEMKIFYPLDSIKGKVSELLPDLENFSTLLCVFFFPPTFETILSYDRFLISFSSLFSRVNFLPLVHSFFSGKSRAWKEDLRKNVWNMDPKAAHISIYILFFRFDSVIFGICVIEWGSVSWIWEYGWKKMKWK